MSLDNIKSPEELSNYMSEKIQYGFVGKNGKVYLDDNSDEWNDWYEQCIVQTAEEVINTKVGTCFDQVELERLWFDNNNYETKTFFVWFEIDEVNNYPTHSFLVFKNNDKWYWFENAFADFRGIHEFDSLDDAIDYVVKQHFEYIVREKIAKEEDEKLLTVYEYPKLNKHLTVDEYIEHVTNSKNKYVR